MKWKGLVSYVDHRTNIFKAILIVGLKKKIFCAITVDRHMLFSSMFCRFWAWHNVSSGPWLILSIKSSVPDFRMNPRSGKGHEKLRKNLEDEGRIISRRIAGKRTITKNMGRYHDREPKITCGIKLFSRILRIINDIHQWIMQKFVFSNYLYAQSMRASRYWNQCVRQSFQNFEEHDAWLSCYIEPNLQNEFRPNSPPDNR